jgi:arabinose-5-phosphate isomerase
MNINIIKRAKEVLEIESRAIAALAARIDENFVRAVNLIAHSKGRVVVSGMGKTGIIAQKFSATLSSTGTPSLFLHLAEAAHGDLGKVTSDDVVVILSNSGATAEVKQLLPFLKKIGSPIIALTGKADSPLAKYSNIVLDVSVRKEACPMGLAPTASTTAALAMADALAVCLLEIKDFKEKDFALFHPGGTLGRRLLFTVEDIMRTSKNHPIVTADIPVSEVLVRITQARAGAATIVDKKGKLAGIFTDGDLRRHLESDRDLPSKIIGDVMTKNPLVVRKGTLAVEALHLMERKKIDEVPVVDEKGRPIGLLDVQDILRAGLV